MSEEEKCASISTSHSLEIVTDFSANSAGSNMPSPNANRAFHIFTKVEDFTRLGPQQIISDGLNNHDGVERTLATVEVKTLSDQKQGATITKENTDTSGQHRNSRQSIYSREQLRLNILHEGSNNSSNSTPTKERIQRKYNIPNKSPSDNLVKLVLSGSFDGTIVSAGGRSEISLPVNNGQKSLTPRTRKRILRQARNAIVDIK